MSGLLLCDDFIWTSRLTGTAQAVGATLRAARTLDQLLKLAEGQSPGCVIIDLAVERLNIVEVVERVKAACPVPPRFVAFGSHIDVAGLKSARDAGCDPVLPRSKFSESLPQLLSEWLCASEPTEPS